MNYEEIENGIKEAKSQVNYISRDYPIDLLYKSYIEGYPDESDFFVPDYQRNFRRDTDRKSKFIESIILNLPIPSIFVADVDWRQEIVDWSQRIRTIVEFLADKQEIKKLNHLIWTSKKWLHLKKLELKNLPILSWLNWLTYEDLPNPRQRRIRWFPIRVVLLDENTTPKTRILLFERINNWWLSLTSMEKRKWIYPGEFYNFLIECSNLEDFKVLCPLSDKKKTEELDTEYVLRFFAYSEDLSEYNWQVQLFLDNYMERNQLTFEKEDMYNKFIAMILFVKNNFPYGFKKKESSNVVNSNAWFEALSVWVSLAIEDWRPLHTANIEERLFSNEFNEIASSWSANNKANLLARINYVKDKLLWL